MGLSLIWGKLITGSRAGREAKELEDPDCVLKGLMVQWERQVTAIAKGFQQKDLCGPQLKRFRQQAVRCDLNAGKACWFWGGPRKGAGLAMEQCS